MFPFIRVRPVVLIAIASLASCEGNEGGDPGTDAAPTTDASVDVATEVAFDAAIPDVMRDVPIDAAPDVPLDIAPDALFDAAPDVPLDIAPDALFDAAPDVALDAAPDVALDAAPDVALDVAPDVPLDIAPDVPLDIAPDVALDAARDVPLDAVTDVRPPSDTTPTIDTTPVMDAPVDSPPADVADESSAIAAPRLLAPLAGARVPSRRPALRWSLPMGVTGARVSLCRDRALTASCVTIDIDGAAGAPTADLAPGVWFWSARGRRGASVGAASAVWRLVVANATVAGAAVTSSEPDVNGDGFADVLGAVQETSLRVYLGGASGPSTAPQVIAPPGEATHFGASLDFAGDVNGDGYGDVVVGASGSDTAYVYFGSAGGLVATPQTLVGPRGSGFGASVAGAGDLDGDGFPDVVGVAPSASAVLFFPGGASGLGASVRLIVGAFTVGRVAGAGDVDGDGRADLLATLDRNYLLRGGTGGIDLGRMQMLTAPGAPAGDVNNDGLADVLIGASLRYGTRGSATPDVALSVPTGLNLSAGPGDYNGDGYSDVAFSSATESGVVAFFAGAAEGAQATPTLGRTGFGTAPARGVTSAGDVDGDGDGDLLTLDATSLYLSRGVRAGVPIAGATDAINFDVPAVAYSRRFVPAAAGDVNRDGRADLVLTHGAHHRVYFGTPTGFAATPDEVTDFPPPNLPGRAVLPYATDACDGVGDMNGDGYADAIALVEDVNFGFDRATMVSLGGTAGLARSPLRFYRYPADGYYQHCTGVGDVDRDGFGDVLFDSVLYFGMATGGFRATSSTLATGTGTFTPSWLGDVNGDGYADVLVQATSTAQVFEGSASGPRSAALAAFAASDFAAAAGDVDHDGFDDLAVPTSAGVAIYRGGRDGFSATPTVTLSAVSRVRAAGDVNRDGFGDLLGLTAAGPVVYFGSARGPAAQPDLRWPGGATGFVTRGPFGFGDLDGDGTGDFVTTSPAPAAVYPLDSGGTGTVQRAGRFPTTRPAVLALPSGSFSAYR